MFFPKHWTVRRDGSHYNASPEWHGYGGRCDQEPRLSYIDRYYRNGAALRDWRVDGQPCATMAEAWERLQTPPTFSAEELAVLSTLTDEPTDLRKVHPYEVLRALRDKGAATADPAEIVTDLRNALDDATARAEKAEQQRAVDREVMKTAHTVLCAVPQDNLHHMFRKDIEIAIAGLRSALSPNKSEADNVG